MACIESVKAAAWLGVMLASLADCRGSAKVEGAPPASDGAAPVGAPPLREAGPLEATPPKEAEQPPENGTIRERLETAGLSVEETRPFFETLQSSVAAGDRAKVCTMMNYPLRVATMSDKIANEASCLQKYDRIFTAPVRDAVHQQRFDDLFANWQGVMIGNGQIWFSGICHDKKCVHKTVKVISIAN